MSGIWSGPDPQIYRYSVRCGRETALAIALAAEAEGVSATALVQAHFETLFKGLGRGAVQKPITRNIAAVDPHDLELAQSNDVSLGAIKVLRVIEAVMDGDGFCEIGIGTIAARTGFTDGSVRVLVSKLVARELLMRLRAGHRGCAVYAIPSRARKAA